MSTLIVVADAARARIFQAEKNLIKLNELEDLIHSESRMSEEDLGAEPPVKSANQKGSLQPRTLPKEHEEQVFARQLATRLQELQNKLRYTALVLVVSPGFLGMLRKELPSQVERLVTRTLDKNLVHLSVDDLGEYLSSK